MRADRLVAIVLLLQVRGSMTAADLAERLEASERTVRRDLEALSAAGVPVYARRGRGGGWSLLGGHRIDLSGLTSAEAEALLLATGPASAASLGPALGAGLAAARRKVLAALPEPLRSQVEAAGSAVLVDPTRWGPAGGGVAVPGPPPPEAAHLEVLRSAVAGGVQALVVYEPPGRPAEERRVHPHGLVCKRGVWYLVATAPSGLRTYRLSRVRSVALTAEPAQRPAGFDLAATWSAVQRRLAERAGEGTVVHVAVAPEALGRLRAMVGAWWSVEDEAAGDDGRARVAIRFPSAAVAAAELAPLGEHAEVVAPQAVRDELAAIALRLLRRYGDGATGPQCSYTECVKECTTR